MSQLWDHLTRPHCLADSKYLLLTAYESDGTPRRHPCKVVRDGDALGIVLRTGSLEADCIRRRGGVLVGACDAQGNPIGPQWPARAMICAPDLTAEYRVALLNKYGLTSMLALALGRLRNGIDGTTGVRLVPAGRHWPVLSPDWRPGRGYNPN
jgi:PPOX class probable F420-dependent enzyme